MDLVGRKMFKPGACRVRKVQRKVANDDSIISRARPAGMLRGNR